MTIVGHGFVDELNYSLVIRRERFARADRSGSVVGRWPLTGGIEIGENPFRPVFLWTVNRRGAAPQLSGLGGLEKLFQFSIEVHAERLDSQLVLLDFRHA